MTISIEQMEELLTGFEPKLLETGKLKRQNSPSIADLVRAKDIQQLTVCLEKSPKLANTAVVMLALVESFDEKIADLLLKAGLDLNKLWSGRGNLIGELNSQFTNWLSSNPSIKEQIIEDLLCDAFEALHGSLSTNQRIVLAEFATQVSKTRPQLCHNVFAEEYSFFTAIITRITENVLPQQWEMVSACIGEDLWVKEFKHLNVIDKPQEFRALLEVCKNIPVLNTILKERFEHSSQEHAWLQKMMMSPSGKIDDCVLVQSLKGKPQQEAQRFLKSNLSKNLSAWKIPENLQVLLLNRDPAVLEEEHYENQGWFTQLYDANGYQSFLHLLLTSCGAKGIELLKSNDKVQEEVCKTFDVLDVPTFLNQSSPSEVKKLLKNFPKLVEWKDVAGNSLGHYIADTSQYDWKGNKDVLTILLKHPQLRNENPYGVAPRKFLSGKYSEQVLAQYDKAVMAQELKNNSTVPVKAKTRRKI